MKKQALLLIVCLFSWMSLCHAEDVFIGVADYVIDSKESIQDAEYSALQYAKRNAVEQAGTYVESLTEVNNHIVTKDEVIVLAAGVAKLLPDSVKKQYQMTDFGMTMRIEAAFSVDRGILEHKIGNKSFGEDKELQARKYYNMALDTRYELRSVKDKEARSRIYQQSKDLLLKAIELKHDFSEALVMLGDWTKADSSNKAIKYYKEAALYDSLNADIYFRIAEIYQSRAVLSPSFIDGIMTSEMINDFKNSVSYYTKAIALKKDEYNYYMERGNCYYYICQYRNAINDYSNAITFSKNVAGQANAFGARSDNYYKMGQYFLSLADSLQAIDLKYSENEWREFAVTGDIKVNYGSFLVMRCITIKDCYEQIVYDSRRNNNLQIVGQCLNNLANEIGLLTQKIENNQSDNSLKVVLYAKRGMCYYWLSGLDDNEYFLSELLDKARSDFKQICLQEEKTIKSPYSYFANGMLNRIGISN